MNTQSSIAIHDLYPQLNEKELVHAEDNLDRYLALVLRIFERLEAEAGPQAEPLAPAVGPLSSTLSDSSS